MDLLKSMTIFVKVAERGSFAPVAKELGISPTAVGNHIRFLEERLGSLLINRTTRQQSLTELGRAYHRRCRQILSDIEDAECQAKGMRSSPRGLLRLTAPVSFGTFNLTPMITDYLTQYPDVDVDLVLTDRVVNLIEEGFELAIRIGTLGDSSLMSRGLIPYRMLICAAPRYLETFGIPRCPEDLVKHNCLNFSGHPLSLWSIGDNVTIDRKIRRLQINSGVALRCAALEGFGIIKQPETILQDDIKAGRLVQLFPDIELPSMPMNIVFLPDRRLTPKLRTFIDHVVLRFGSTAREAVPLQDLRQIIA